MISKMMWVFIGLFLGTSGFCSEEDSKEKLYVISNPLFESNEKQTENDPSLLNSIQQDFNQELSSEGQDEVGDYEGDDSGIVKIITPTLVIKVPFCLSKHRLTLVNTLGQGTCLYPFKENLILESQNLSTSENNDIKPLDDTEMTENKTDSHNSDSDTNPESDTKSESKSDTGSISNSTSDLDDSIGHLEVLISDTKYKYGFGTKEKFLLVFEGDKINPCQIFSLQPETHINFELAKTTSNALPTLKLDKTSPPSQDNSAKNITPHSTSSLLDKVSTFLKSNGPILKGVAYGICLTYVGQWIGIFY